MSFASLSLHMRRRRGRLALLFVLLLDLCLCSRTVSFVSAVPGAPDLYRMRNQRCSTGCVASIMVACAMIAIVISGLVCCCAWYSPELKTRAVRRRAAQHEVDVRTRAMNMEINAKQAEYNRTHEDMCTRMRREQEEAERAAEEKSRDGSKTEYSHSKSKSGKVEEQTREEDNRKKKAAEAEAEKDAKSDTNKDGNKNTDALEQQRKVESTDAKNKAKAQEHVKGGANTASDDNAVDKAVSAPLNAVKDGAGVAKSSLNDAKAAASSAVKSVYKAT